MPRFGATYPGRPAVFLLLSLAISTAIPLPASMGLPARQYAAPAAVSVTAGSVQVGTSFNPRHAAHLGLAWKDAYLRLVAMRFKVIRLSAYWDQVDEGGYQKLDWLLEESRARGQPVVLSIGMKGLGWPEYYLPGWLTPRTPDGGDIGQEEAVGKPALDFVRTTVERYRDNPALIAWQVENEPLNPAGPHRWYIGRELLAKEVALLRGLDRRPLIVNAFGHFNMLFDRTSNRSGFDFRSLLGFESDTAEAQSLGILGKSDILGLDIYTEIGYSLLGHTGVSHAGSDWAAKAGHWRRVAAGQGKQAWITEAQAEPWEASTDTYGDPRSTVASDIPARFASIRAQGFGTVLLWGAEYWLWRADRGDSSWLDAVARILHDNGPAAALPPASNPR